MNIFHIMYLYLRMKQDPNYRITPTTYFFSAKAALATHWPRRSSS